MKQAVVKWFNDSKGYGFVILDDGQEAFLHYTGIETNGFKTVTEGQTVYVTQVLTGVKGLQVKVTKDIK